MSLLQRFSEKYKVDSSGCWLWTGAVSRRYGHIALGGGRGQRGAHRVSWMLHRGSVPDGVCVLHRCDVPLCVNPEHLFLGTEADNTRDMMRKGRQRTPKGERHGSAKLMDSEVDAIRRLARITPQTVLAKQFGVSDGHVSEIVNWKTRKTRGRNT